VNGDVVRLFHELWLGMVQPVEGLVVSVPVLLNAQCYERQPPSTHKQFLELCTARQVTEAAVAAKGSEAPRIASVPRLLSELLQLTAELWEAQADYHSEHGWAGALPDCLQYYAADGGQLIRPSLGLKKLEASGSAAMSDVSEAGRFFELLLWELPEGLLLDQQETVTGPWDYAPSAKFERLLRAAKVPIGLLTNRDVLRLIYAPAGESTGHIDFRVADMATVGGRPILDALLMLLNAHRFFGVAPELALPALLRDSRKYQADVTVTLGKQVLEALTILLRGFEAAAARDGMAQLEAALARGDDHVYHGLLTVLLRLVFVLYAEDRELLPVEHRLYSQHYSLFALFAELQADHGAYPDSMALRFGAWGRIVALCRALFVGVKSGELQVPERRGALFDPNTFAFLEGWDPEGSAPIRALKAQSEVQLPTLDDETVFSVLCKLILLDGQRLSYRALDVEQIGSVYEGLMGYHVKRVSAEAVCTRPDGVWVSADEVLAVAPAQRASWLAEQLGLSKAQAKSVAEQLHGLRSEAKVFEVLEGLAQGRSKEDRAKARAHAGQLVLQPGQERRRTSSHYTPRSLSTQVVDRALQPLLATMTPEGAAGPSSESILQLRVCDPAMGSGAFLVEACRYLGDALEAAWRREGKLGQYRDPTLAARRRVAQCCLYGVDKNPTAVELAKLSLWLVTMEKHRPFTFMDGSLRHGDSLVGLSLDQLRAFHWQPSRQLELDAQVIGLELDEAIALRQRLIELALAENGVNPDPREKEIVWRDFEDAVARLRLIADVCIGAFFAADSDKAREQERARRLALVRAWMNERDAQRSAAAERELGALQAELRKAQVPFHWMLEFPDVFWSKRPDPLDLGKTSGAAFIDAFVGNPPFMGGSQVSSRFGDAYRDWLPTLHQGAHGNADLSAHFFRRASTLLGRHGTVGLISTNTIGQGDTRSTGLQQLVEDGLVIFDAKVNMPWPGDAAVTVSVAHLAKSLPPAIIHCRLDDVHCRHINSALQAGAERTSASPLQSNESAAYLGTKIYGQGFLLTPEERADLIKKNRRNAARIFPYLGGEEVNTSPTQTFDRYVISFGTMDLDEASAWPDLLDIVREKVKPDRDKLRDNADGSDYKKRWWQYAKIRTTLYQAIAPLERCLVTSRHSKHLCFSFQPTDRILSEALYVFPLHHYTAFATLQSRIHEPWARLLSSSMKTDLRYSASDCFETFPFPHADPRAQIPAVEQAGKTLYETRAKLMVETNLGLTKTYNALKDPQNQDRTIVHLRTLHEAMDRAVLDAYGWQDLQVPPFCPRSEAEQAELKRFEAEVVDRLYALNAERAAEEERLGLGKPSKLKKQLPANTNISASKASALKPPRSTRPRKSAAKTPRKKRASIH